MRSLLLLIILLLLLGSFLFFIFKGCTGFVPTFDGEEKSKMVLLAGGYYFNKSDRQIWQREEVTDSYKNISNVYIDSLVWNSDHIIGYANKKYFIIILKTGEYKTLSDKNVIQKIASKDYKQLQELPPLSFY